VASSKLPGLKAATRAHYIGVLGNHILPELGDFYLDAITSTDVARWRDAIPGKPATVNSKLRVLKTLLRDAVHDKNLPRDPTVRVAAVRQFREEDDPNCLTADELRRFLAAALELTSRSYPLFCALAFTGGRFGEVTALKWSDIDEEAGSIRIRRAQWKGTVDETKTGVARTLPLPVGLLAVLREHRRVLVAKQAAGLSEGWVFPGRGGKLLHNTTLRAAMQTCAAAAGIPHRFSVHGFRRTFNNLMRQVTEDKVVLRSMTGHATEEMTEHYSHVALREKHAGVAQLMRLVPTFRAVERDRSGDSGGDAPFSENRRRALTLRNS
jgi:integrase